MGVLLNTYCLQLSEATLRWKLKAGTSKGLDLRVTEATPTKGWKLRERCPITRQTQSQKDASTYLWGPAPPQPSRLASTPDSYTKASSST